MLVTAKYFPIFWPNLGVSFEIDFERLSRRNNNKNQKAESAKNKARIKANKSTWKLWQSGIFWGTLQWPSNQIN